MLPRCPATPGGQARTKPFRRVSSHQNHDNTQKPGSRDGKLSFLELGTVNAVTTNGGLLFYQGAVTAIIPPGALDTDMHSSDFVQPEGATMNSQIFSPCILLASTVP